MISKYQPDYLRAPWNKRYAYHINQIKTVVFNTVAVIAVAYYFFN